MDRVNAVMAHKLGLSRPPQDTTEPTGLQAQAQTEAPTTPMRLMRRALRRAADTAANLTVTVLGISEGEADAEALIEEAPAAWIVLGLRDGASAGLTGLCLISPELRSALVAMQTTGTLAGTVQDTRAVTGTDAMMSIPFADALLGELAQVGFGAPDLVFTGFAVGVMPDLRTAGLVMMQGHYRSWRITLELGGGQHQGELILALRPDIATKRGVVAADRRWSDALRQALEGASAELDAVLCRMAMSINTIEGFAVGQVLQLAGTTVGSVTLTGPDGKAVAAARLGQMAGQRAVKLEVPEISLQEMRHRPSSAAASVLERAAQNNGPDMTDGEATGLEATLKRP